VAVGELRVLGAVGLLGALVDVGAGLCPVGSVRLLGTVRAVGHVAPAGRTRLRIFGVGSSGSRGSRSRIGPVGLLGALGRVGLTAGERWCPGLRPAAARLRLLGVLGLLRGLGPVGSVGLHRRVGAVGALRRYGLLGHLGVLGTVGLVGHTAGRPAAVRGLRIVGSAQLGLVVELGARIRFLRFTGALTPARTVTDPGERSADRRRSEEGRAAGTPRTEEVGHRPRRLHPHRHDSCRGQPGDVRIRCSRGPRGWGCRCRRCRCGCLPYGLGPQWPRPGGLSGQA
jgi:hypothetical protein